MNRPVLPKMESVAQRSTTIPPLGAYCFMENRKGLLVVKSVPDLSRLSAVAARMNCPKQVGMHLVKPWNRYAVAARMPFSAPFLLSLDLLLLNDQVGKDLFHNALTGKLSDFAGLFSFVLC